MALENAADEYFSKLNSIASRIYVDLNETKSSYEDLWTTLSEEEKKQILTETIIKPEISIKYKSPNAANEKYSTNNKFASKRVIDDNNYSYRDEHSGPFSFKTPSQRDLTIFEKKKTHNKRPAPPRPKQKKTEETVLINKTEDIVLMDKSDNESNCSTLPKTGLDFLDNW